MTNQVGARIVETCHVLAQQQFPETTPTGLLECARYEVELLRTKVLEMALQAERVRVEAGAC